MIQKALEDDHQKRATTRRERRILGKEKGERSDCLGLLVEPRST
jgi:hypothetical protein